MIVVILKFLKPVGIPLQQRDSSLPSSPTETTSYESNSSSGSDPYEDFLEYNAAQEKSLPLFLAVLTHH
ncbi:hypothetical protein Tco_0889333 [Tanacetum coccineum]